VAVLVPALYLPSAQPVHFVSSDVFSVLVPAVKYWPFGQLVCLEGQEVAVLVPTLYLPSPQAGHE